MIECCIKTDEYYRQKTVLAEDCQIGAIRSHDEVNTPFGTAPQGHKVNLLIFFKCNCKHLAINMNFILKIERKIAPINENLNINQ